MSFAFLMRCNPTSIAGVSVHALRPGLRNLDLDQIADLAGVDQHGLQPRRFAEHLVGLLALALDQNRFAKIRIIPVNDRLSDRSDCYARGNIRAVR